MSLYLALRLLRLIHIYAAIVLVGSIVFNTLVLVPSLRRIPPAHSAVVAQKIGGGLMALGGGAIVLLGVTGFVRLWLVGQLGLLFSARALAASYSRWLALMVGSWLILAVVGTVTGIWYRRILSRKLPYSAGLRELEERRASQAWVSAWQDRLHYINLALALLATLGGVMATF